MNYIEIFYKKTDYDVVSRTILKQIETAGYDLKLELKTEHIYKLEGEISEDELETIASKLLVDPIIQNFSINAKDSDERYKKFFIVDIWQKKGVTDSVGETIQNSIKTLGINKNLKVGAGVRYLIYNNLDEKIATKIVEKILTNSIIQDYILRKN